MGFQRGYSPRLMTIGVGEGLQIGKNENGPAFSQDHTSAMSCSPMRKIAEVWGAGITTETFAERLFKPSDIPGGDDGAARATCQQMKSLVNAPSSTMPAADAMGDYFGTTKPLAYMTAAEDASVQPQWMFQLETDKSTTVNDAIRCGSRYKIKGAMQTNLNAASQCHHEDANGNWVKSSTSTTSTLADGVTGGCP